MFKIFSIVMCVISLFCFANMADHWLKDKKAAEKALEIEIRQNNLLKAQNEGMLKELSEMYTVHAKALTARKGN